MTAPILRKNLSFAQQIAIDRHYDEYVMGGCWNPFDRSAGTDCSDCVGKELAATRSGTAMDWGREVDTEDWRPPAAGGNADPANGPYGTIMVDNPTQFPADAAVLIALHHGDGSAADSHMWCQVDKLKIETHGSSNEYPNGATVLNDGTHFTDTVLDVHDTGYANNWWYLAGPIKEDGTPIPTQASPTGGAVTAPKILATGVDYSAGAPGGAAIVGAGYTFACRYVFDGSPQLPFKLLTKAEADDLWANGVDIVSNYESTGVDALQGFAQGAADATEANDNHLAAGGPPTRPILFSLDWDESEGQDPAVFAYFQGVNSVIGLDRTGAYGGYWIIKRLFDAGLISYGWQTEAWSSDPAGLGSADIDGNYYEPRAQLLQRNDQGYVTISGIQCDIDVALGADFGQWHYQVAPAPTPVPAPSPAPAPLPDYTRLIYEQLCGPIDSASGYGTGWPQLSGEPKAIAALQNKLDAGAGLYLVDAIAADMYGLKSASPIPIPASAPTPPAAPPEPRAIVATPDTPTRNPLKQTPMSYLHAIITLLGGAIAIATYLIAHHIVSGAIAAAISSAVVAATSLLNYLVKEENPTTTTQGESHD